MGLANDVDRRGIIGLEEGRTVGLGVADHGGKISQRGFAAITLGSSCVDKGRPADARLDTVETDGLAILNPGVAGFECNARLRNGE